MVASKRVSLIIIAAIIFGTGLPLYKLYATDSNEDASAVSAKVVADQGASLELPAFAKKDANTMRAYQIAVSRKEEFKFLSCHCGCGMHAMSHRGKTIPKMNNLADCFVRSDGTWEDHAAFDCPYCVNLAIMADDLLGKGYTLKQIRELIDTKYNSIAPSMKSMDMNPPMPPG